MLSTAAQAKIRLLFETEIISPLKNSVSMLYEGGLGAFEESLYGNLQSLYGKLAEEVLLEVSKSDVVVSRQRVLAGVLGVGKLIVRPAEVQLRTGHRARLPSLYAKRPQSGGGEGPRHMLHALWSVRERASPSFMGQMALHGVLCGSYDVARQVLGHSGISVGLERLRTLCTRLSRHCCANRAEMCLKEGETLSGKRVLISLDGGRSRTRRYTGQTNAKGTHYKFETPWREPKMLLISVLDDDGRPAKDVPPIYDAAFVDDEIVNILRGYLRKLEVWHAKSVQVVADGAPWIWNRARPLLIELGVPDERIVETVDYYHAVQNLNKSIALLPLKTDKEKKEAETTLKSLLWNGNIERMVQEYTRMAPGLTAQDTAVLLQYFHNNADRMYYAKLRKLNLPCGSGSMESAIRRVICLRFKCPSAFWTAENLPGLIFLRGVLLAKRWDILVQKIATNYG